MSRTALSRELEPTVEPARIWAACCSPGRYPDRLLLRLTWARQDTCKQSRRRGVDVGPRSPTASPAHRHGGPPCLTPSSIHHHHDPAGLRRQAGQILQAPRPTTQMVQLWVMAVITSKCPHRHHRSNLQPDDAANQEQRQEGQDPLAGRVISEVACERRRPERHRHSHCADMIYPGVDAQGKDAHREPTKARIPAGDTMVPGSNGHWLASEEEETGEPNTARFADNLLARTIAHPAPFPNAQCPAGEEGSRKGGGGRLSF